MKQIVKKNQFIITALAIMIAVAGYLNYAQKNGAQNQYLAVNNLNEGTDNLLSDISDEDIFAENQALLAAKEEETSSDEGIEAGNEIENQEETLAEIDSLDIDLENSNPGEAVLTSGTNSLARITAIKLNREQVRAANKEVLMGIINNSNITEEQKQAAINGLLESTNISEREAAAEMLLEAKGFSDVVVSITDESVDVVVNMSALSDADRAQIEDIVKRKTEISAEKIIITPVADIADEK